MLRNNNINYLDKSKIIQQFNSSISLYKRFASVLEAGDDELAAKKLHDAGTSLYQCVEWSLKNYLYKRYQELEAEALIGRAEKNSRIEQLNGRNSKLNYLLEEFKINSKPTYNSFGINTGVIEENARTVSNLPKHNSNVPDPNAYRKVVSELRKIIINYLDNSAELDLIDNSIFGEGNSWYELSEYTSDFSDIYSYVLVINRRDNINYDGLFSIKWSLILDFDPSTDTNGAARIYEDLSNISPWKRMLNKIESKREITNSNKPYWIFANGIIDEKDTIESIDKWKNRSGKYLTDLLEKFHESYTKNVKVFMVPIGNEKATEKITDSFTDVYDDDVDFFMLSADSEYTNIDLENFKIINLKFEQFCDNLKMAFSKESIDNKNFHYLIPAEANNSISLSESFAAELSDSFEVVFVDCILEEENDAKKTNRYDFYNGNIAISWYGIKEQFDVVRKSKDSIIKKINDDMSDRGRLLRKVYYEPGIGGTTMLRRIAFEMRESYPTLILKQYNEQAGKNIQKLYDLTHLPILLLVDNNYIAYEDAIELQSELKKMGFAFVIVYFERKLRGQKKSSAYTIITEFNQSEALEMKEKLSPYIEKDNKLEALNSIVNSNDSNEKSPFIMSMYAFDDKFAGIKPYIHNFLLNLNIPCRKILFSLSLADYGNVSLDADYFNIMFNDDSANEFLIEETPGIYELVRQERIAEKKFIKIRYHLFAEEILKQLSGNYNSTEITFNSLIDDILGFIEDSRANVGVVNSNTLSVLRSLFITRVADEDSEKPAFSPLISKLKEESRINHYGTYDGSNDAIIRIFNKLVEVYPEEPHFIAHLARYYFYIDKNSDKGFELIDKAIDLYETMNNGDIDPLLYHMKAMGFATIIDKYITQLYKENSNDNQTEISKLIFDIEESANKAFALFKKVRECNKGIAGHISEINLCIRIANMARDLIDTSKVFNSYIISNDGEWVMKYIDKAMDLWEECKNMITDIESEEYKKIEVRLKQLMNNLEQSIDLWESFILNSTGDNRTQARRILARAYEKQNNDSMNDEQKQKNLIRIIELMQDNMDEDGSNAGNIRLWFEAVMKLKSDNPESIIMDAVTKLNKWIVLTDSVDAHYYRFVLKFIQAIHGSSLAENELPKLLKELKNKSQNLYNRTIPQHWLYNVKDGLGALVSNSRNRKEIIPEDELAQKLYPLVGRISSNYVNESHAYIKCKGVEIYYNPSATKGEISKSQINQLVRFGIGFSYDGPRAYNSSIKLMTTDEFIPVQEELNSGKIVKCEVIENINYYTRVRIIGAIEPGSIHINDYCEPYDAEKRPKIGYVFDGKLLAKRYDDKRNQYVWSITMNVDSNDFYDKSGDTTMALAIKNMKTKDKK